MSFRGRLTVFFVAIVVVPMIAVAVLVIAVTADSPDGKADARLAGGLATAQEIYDEALHAAPRRSTGSHGMPDVVPAMAGLQPRLSCRRSREGELDEPTSSRSASTTRTASSSRPPGPRDALARSRRPLERARAGSARSRSPRSAPGITCTRSIA